MPLGLSTRNTNICPLSLSPPPPCDFHNLPPELIIKILTSVSTPLESRRLLSNHLTTCPSATCYLLEVHTTHKATIDRTLLTSLPGAPHLLNLYRLLLTADPEDHLSTQIDYGDEVAVRAVEKLSRFAGVNVHRFLTYWRGKGWGRGEPTEGEMERVCTGVYILAYLTLIGIMLHHNAHCDCEADRVANPSLPRNPPTLECYELDDILDRPTLTCLGPLHFPRRPRRFLPTEILHSPSLSHITSEDLLYTHHISCTLLSENRDPCIELRMFTVWCGDMFWRARGGYLINRVNFWLVGERNRVVEVVAKELCRRGGGGRGWWGEDVRVGWPLVPRPGTEGEGEGEGEGRRWGRWEKGKEGWGVWDGEREEVRERLGEGGREWEVLWW